MDFAVTFENEDGELTTWTAHDALDEGHAVDLAREQHGDDINIMDADPEGE